MTKQTQTDTLTPEKLEEIAFETTEQRQKKEQEEKNNRTKDAAVSFAKSSALSGMKAGAGTGNMAFGFFESAAAASNTYVELVKNLTEKEKIELDEALGGLDIESVLNSIGSEQDPNARAGILSGFKNRVFGIRDHTVDLKLEDTLKRLKLVQNIQNKLTDVTMGQYWTSEGRLDMAQMIGRAGDIADQSKRKTSSSTLDYMKERGAEQVDMPQIPDDAQAFLAETITAMMGDIVKNAMAMGSGGSTLVAAATTTSASQVASDRVSRMMELDVSQHRDKVEKIRMLNEELRIKHESDVVNLMMDYENRLGQDERLYIDTKMRALGNEMATAYEVMGMQMQGEQFLTTLDLALDEIENKEKITNVELKRQRDITNANFANDALNRAMRLMEAEMNFQARMAKRVKPAYDPKKGIIALETSNVTAAGSAYKWSDAVAQTLDDTPENRNAFVKGDQFAKELYVKVNQMVKDGRLKPEQAGNVIQNALVISANETNILNNTTDAAIMAMAEERITSPAGASNLMSKGLSGFISKAPEGRKFSAYNVAFVDGIIKFADNIYSVKEEAYKRQKKRYGSRPITAFDGAD